MITYSIFDDVIKLKDIVDDFFNDTGYRSKGYNFPPVNVYTNEEEMEIRAYVPGVEVDNVDIELVDENLVISGEKKDDYADQAYIRKERSFGEFKKRIPLPYRIDREKVKADLINGVLIIKLVKSEDAKPKKIEIN
jgi:HSP20 family protein